MKIVTGKEKEFEEFVKLNSDDDYGKGCVDFMIRWADLMEPQIEDGKRVEDIAKTTSHDADTEGITGCMYGIAVSYLKIFWVHGKELNKWHNQSYGGTGDERGTINPAILYVKVDKT